MIYFIPLLFVAVFILRSFTDFLNGYAFQQLGLGATNDLRNDLYARTLAQTSRFHAEHPSGELVSRVVHDVGVLQAAVSTRLVDLVQQSVTLVGLLCLLFSIQFKLALFCVVAAPLVLYPIVRFSKSMRKTSHRTQERTADLANLVSESCRGHRVVKAFGMEAFEEARFREATRRHLRANLRGQMLSNLSGPVIESLGVIGAGVFLVFAGRAIHSHSMEPGVLVKFLIGLYAMYDPIRKLNKVNLVVQQSMAAAQRIRGLMTLPVEIQDRPGAGEAPDLATEIRFENVSFRYEEKEVLSGVDLAVRPGEAVALVGPSGGGKTTLCNLVPRFFDVTGGRILIDGTDLRDIRLASLRSKIGLVTQETVLFNDTVRANIAYGRKDLPLEKVREAALAAYADEFILELPEGYDTIVGEGGVRLSGGQRQRLAIARALLKNAPILILDEATSMLDTESESLVQKALGNLMRDRTTFVIAHRLTTITMVDRIFVLEAGRIVEQGTPRGAPGRRRSLPTALRSAVPGVTCALPGPAAPGKPSLAGGRLAHRPDEPGALRPHPRSRRHGRLPLSRRRDGALLGAQGRPFILAFWHRYLVLMRYAYFGSRMSVLVSQSWDGELTAQTLAHLGIDTCRGSTSQGGAAALRDLLRRARDGSDLAFTPDGPRGPLRRVQPGVIVAAALSGLPIQPVAIGATRRKLLRSWDRMLVPLAWRPGRYPLRHAVRRRTEEPDPGRGRSSGAGPLRPRRASGGAFGVACRSMVDAGRRAGEDWRTMAAVEGRRWWCRRGRSMKSMTGFGQSIVEVDGLQVSVTLQGVNHRYLDLVLRLPEDLRFLEAAMRERLVALVRRGRCEASSSCAGCTRARSRWSCARGRCASSLRPASRWSRRATWWGS